MMKHTMAPLLATALVGLALAAPVFAQGPGPGGQNAGRGGGQRRPGAGGTVSAVDAIAGTITLTPQNGGTAQVIKVGPDAQIQTQQTVNVSDLKVGDMISVQGMPTGITASQITVGQLVAGLAGGRGGGGANPAGGAGANAGAPPPPQGTAFALGTIKTLPTTTDPHIAITLGPDVQVFLKLAAGAKITKYTTLALSGIKAGDQITARGQTDVDGTLTASVVGVNLVMGGGRGGFGGGFGGGQGGFGGGRGGRRGGQGGGGNGGPGGQGGFGGPGGQGGFGGGQGGFGGPPPAGVNPPPPGQ